MPFFFLGRFFDNNFCTKKRKFSTQNKEKKMMKKNMNMKCFFKHKENNLKNLKIKYKKRVKKVQPQLLNEYGNETFKSV